MKEWIWSRSIASSRQRHCGRRFGEIIAECALVILRYTSSIFLSFEGYIDVVVPKMYSISSYLSFLAGHRRQNYVHDDWMFRMPCCLPTLSSSLSPQTR